MLCRKQHAEIGLVASKIMILILKIKNALAQRKSLKTKNWKHYFMKAQAKLTESLWIDHTIVSKHLKALEINQK